MAHLNATGLTRVLNHLKTYFAKKADTVFSVNSNLPDANGNVEITQVEIANNLLSTESQLVTDEFIMRPSGGSASVDDGNASISVIRGNTTHTGIVEESITMTVTPAARSQGVDPIDAEIDEDAFKEYVSVSSTITLTYTDEWSANPLLYGVTVTGDPVNGDQIVIVYVKENRGTITPATPSSFRSTGWNLYNHSTGYARVMKYSNDYGFLVGGTYVSLQFATTVAGERSDITVTQGAFTVPSDGYVFVNGGTSTDTYILMTHSDWTEGYEGDWEAYTETYVDLAGAMENFPYGLLRIGIHQDEINFNTRTVTSVINRMAYSDDNIAVLEAAGTEYEADENYIYYVKDTPDSFPFNADSEYTVSDHGMEYFIGTTVNVYAQTLYGENLRDKLRTDVVTISPMSLTESQKSSVRNTIGLGGYPAADSAEAMQTALGIAPLLVRSVQSGTWSSTNYTGTTTTFSCRRIGLFATITLDFEKSSTQTGSGFQTIGTIPSGYYPVDMMYATVPIQASSASAVIRLSHAGTVSMYANHTTSGRIRCSITFPLHSDQL